MWRTAQRAIVQPMNDRMHITRRGPQGPAIEVDGLVKRYGPTVAVDQLSFTAAYGRVTALIGPNGAGKTTTLRALLGLIRPTAGSLTIGGHRYQELDCPAKVVGALLDARTAHPGRRAREHLRIIALAAGISFTRADELLALVELDTAADRRVGTFSLGMRQRLGLAAALLGDPSILVLDEPANGLDPQGIRWLRDLMRSLASDGRAVLLSSHVLAEVAQTADDTIVIGSGRVLLQAQLAELLAEHAGGVRVTGPEAAALATILRHDGAHVLDIAPDAIIVQDRSEDHVLHTIARHQLLIDELLPLGSTLEEIYLELTTRRQS
jgi:ABC-2 type transport system ATP-binding protein